MSKVMAFGTFDGLHPGHRYFLDLAASYGTDLVIVVARDATVRKVKGRAPMRSEEERRQALQDAGYHARLGSLGDKYGVIAEEKPDVICLGYDQEAFTERLEEKCRALGLPTRVVRLPAHHPEKYKSSLLNK